MYIPDECNVNIGGDIDESKETKQKNISVA